MLVQDLERQRVVLGVVLDQTYTVTFEQLDLWLDRLIKAERSLERTNKRMQNMVSEQRSQQAAVVPVVEAPVVGNTHTLLEFVDIFNPISLFWELVDYRNLIATPPSQLPTVPVQPEPPLS